MSDELVEARSSNLSAELRNPAYNDESDGHVRLRAADEIDRLTERLAGAYASVNLLTEMHEKAVAEGAELRRVTKALVKAFRAPYPFAEQGRAAQDAWAVAREDSLLNAVAVLGEQP